jgi:hypothetical protein
MERFAVINGRKNSRGGRPSQFCLDINNLGLFLAQTWAVSRTIDRVLLLGPEDTIRGKPIE